MSRSFKVCDQVEAVAPWFFDVVVARGMKGRETDRISSFDDVAPTAHARCHRGSTLANLLA